MRWQFGLAGALHTNCYEAWLGAETVERYLLVVERLVGKLGGRRGISLLFGQAGKVHPPSWY